MRRFSFLLLLSFLLTAGLAQANPDTVLTGFSSQGSNTIYVVAARQDGQWMTQRDMAGLAGPDQSGQPWQLFGLTSSAKSINGQRLEVNANGTLKAKLASGAPINALAVRGGTASQPRTATLAKNAAVVDALTAYLRGKGVSLAKARVTQCASVDLLGDGRTEWLVCGSSRDQFARGDLKDNPSDYSFAVMMWDDPKQGGLHIEPLSVETIGNPNGVNDLYEFVGVADLDGSGKMVAALRSHYYMGGRFGVWTFDGESVSRQMTGGWQQ